MGNKIIHNNNETKGTTYFILMFDIDLSIESP